MTVPTQVRLRLTDNRKEVYDYLKMHRWYLSINRSVFMRNDYLYITNSGVSFDNDEHFFNNHRYTEVFFYDGAFHYENEQTKNDEGERMTKQINYTNDWYIDCPKTEEEWDIFVKIMEHFGVSLFSKQYEPTWAYIRCCLTNGNPHLSRYKTVANMRKVTLLEAITLLQRPVKTEQQLKIEELEATIAKAQEQIKELKSNTFQSLL